jgi:hypothetical protein
MGSSIRCRRAFHWDMFRLGGLGGMGAHPPVEKFLILVRSWGPARFRLFSNGLVTDFRIPLEPILTAAGTLIPTDDHAALDGRISTPQHTSCDTSQKSEQTNDSDHISQRTIYSVAVPIDN